jgi:hypothetical protein
MKTTLLVTASAAAAAATRASVRRPPDDITDEVAAVACDVTDKATPQLLVGTAIERYGRLDILVNDAGIIQVGPVQSTGARPIRSGGAHDGTRAGAHDPYRAAGDAPQAHGRIVNITSIGGKVSVPHLLAYSVAEFAAAGFSAGCAPISAPTRWRHDRRARPDAHRPAPTGSAHRPAGSGFHLVLARRQPAAGVDGSRARGSPDRRGHAPAPGGGNRHATGRQVPGKDLGPALNQQVFDRFPHAAARRFNERPHE